MNRKAFARECERLEAYFVAWQEPLGLSGWRITRRYCQSTEAFREDAGPGSDGAFMSTRPDWEYLQGTVYIDCSATATMGDWQVEAAVVHELVHHLLQELAPLMRMTPDVRRHVEHVTSSLALAYMWVRDRAAKGKEILDMGCGEDDGGGTPPVTGETT